MNRPRLPLYLDTAATTPLAPEVLAAMVEQLGDPRTFANPSSAAHVFGRAAADLVDTARAEIAAEFGCQPDEVIFTAGATEANNLALRGLALAHADQGRHLIVSRIEHRAVLACCESLAREGFEIDALAPDALGHIRPETVAAAIRPDTLLISLMHTNNETGVRQPIEAVAALAAERGVLLHVDAAQAAAKFRIRLDDTPIDLLSLSAHKFHGPKGIGCLIARNRRRLGLRPLMHGGGQEFGLRPGTLPTHQIVGLATALKLTASRRDRDLQRVAELKRHLIQRLRTWRRWNEVVTAIERLGDAPPEQAALLKTIGLLNILGAQGQLKASPALIALCGGPERERHLAELLARQRFRSGRGAAREFDRGHSF